MSENARIGGHAGDYNIRLVHIQLDQAGIKADVADLQLFAELVRNELCKRNIKADGG